MAAPGNHGSPILKTWHFFPPFSLARCAICPSPRLDSDVKGSEVIAKGRLLLVFGHHSFRVLVPKLVYPLHMSTAFVCRPIWTRFRDASVRKAALSGAAVFVTLQFIRAQIAPSVCRLQTVCSKVLHLQTPPSFLLHPPSLSNVSPPVINVSRPRKIRSRSRVLHSSVNTGKAPLDTPPSTAPNPLMHFTAHCSAS